MNKPVVSAITYRFELTVEEFIVWNKDEDVFVTLSNFYTVLDLDYDGMYGAFIWVTVSNNSELDRIEKFIYNHSRVK